MEMNIQKDNQNITQNIKQLYILQSIIGNNLMEPAVDRIPRDKEIRGKRKLELLDIFASLINGRNICTACFLNVKDNIIYISVNTNDDIKTTVEFANDLLSQMQNITRQEKINISESDKILTSILNRNFKQIDDYIDRAKHFKKYSNYLDTLDNVEEYKDLFKNKPELKHDNVFTYIKKYDELYDLLKQKDQSTERDSLLLFLRKVSYLRWYYIKLMKCMRRLQKLNINIFSSITKVCGVGPIESFNETEISYKPTEIINNLYKYNILDNIEETKKICSYMNLKIDDISEIEELPTLSDEEIASTFTGKIHAEISLICFLLKNNIIDGEIGTSKLCCVPCCMFINMLTRRNIAEFNKSGSHGKHYPAWLFPIPEDRFEKEFNNIAKDINTLLFISFMKKYAKKVKKESVTVDMDIDSLNYSSDEATDEILVS